MKAPKDLDAWGRDTAKSRYGTAAGGTKPKAGQSLPQFPEDKHGPKYDNNTPSNWLRGMGSKGAEGKPGFDKGKR
jgi:hypothetical protein